MRMYLEGVPATDGASQLARGAETLARYSKSGGIGKTTEFIMSDPRGPEDWTGGSWNRRNQCGTNYLSSFNRHQVLAA